VNFERPEKTFEFVFQAPWQCEDRTGHSLTQSSQVSVGDFLALRPPTEEYPLGEVYSVEGTYFDRGGPSCKYIETRDEQALPEVSVLLTKDEPEDSNLLEQLDLAVPDMPAMLAMSFAPACCEPGLSTLVSPMPAARECSTKASRGCCTDLDLQIF